MPNMSKASRSSQSAVRQMSYAVSISSLLSDNGLLNLAPEHAQSAAATIKAMTASRTGKAIVVGISAGVLLIGVLEAISPGMPLWKKIVIGLVAIGLVIAAYFLLSHQGVIVS